MSDLIRSLLRASAVWGRHLGSLLLLLIASVVWGAEPTTTTSSQSPDAPILGWRPGTPAAGTASALAPVDPIPMAIPDRVAQRVEGETAVYYFSPTCGHCRAAMPDITALQGKGDIEWLGIAVSSATPEEIEEFRSTFAIEFPIITDVDRQFARAVGARSTPSVYVMRPMPAATAESADGSTDESTDVSTDESGDNHSGHDHAGHDHSGHGHGPITHPLLQMGSPPGHAEVLMTQAYPPFVRGAGPVLLMRSHLDQPFADFSGYQGDVVCRGCHEQEALSMAISHHAVALYTLYQREEHDNPECVSCHVTGMGEPGGYVMGDLSHPLADVQCEACHGPSGPHDGVSTDARSQCVGCHDEKHSVAFSVEKGLPFIDHYAANGLSDAQLRERLEALAAGTADKPLLAFPEGPSVGVATCRSCHSDIHASWKKSPHGRAMKSLRKDDKRSDPECVSCHATQKAYGPGVPTTEVAHFRTDESVGCESCHGPGAVHASEPRKDNIVGLSGSCPECVIEAICTSCHTPEWDPEWNLSERLEALDHHAADDAP